MLENLDRLASPRFWYNGKRWPCYSTIIFCPLSNILILDRLAVHYIGAAYVQVARITTKYKSRLFTSDNGNAFPSTNSRCGISAAWLWISQVCDFSKLTFDRCRLPSILLLIDRELYCHLAPKEQVAPCKVWNLYGPTWLCWSLSST